MTTNTHFPLFFNVTVTQAQLTLMPLVANILDNQGRIYLENITPEGCEKQKSEAIKAFEAAISNPDLSKSSKVALFDQFLLAAQVQLHHFAIEDTDDISAKMQGFLVSLYKAALNTDSEAIFEKRSSLLFQIAEKVKNSKVNYAENNAVPVMRAKMLLQKLADIDPLAAGNSRVDFNFINE